jgi:hypothetical protein
MARVPILKADQSYTFRSYFELPYEAEDILAEFDYSLLRSRLSLPRSDRPLDRLADLQQRLNETLPLVSLSSEAARRELLIAPILVEVARYCHCQLRIEYPLMVSNWLKGNLDYLLRGENRLLVVEAKNDDLTRGFTQLAVEMIAVAHLDDTAVLYGAVTIGNAWQFGKLDRLHQQITQDVVLYPALDHLEVLLRILIGILAGD